MPFIITEPQRIEGTKLGFAVYSYRFSFEDHIDFSKKYDQKLMIFKLKDAPFNEVEGVLHEHRFLFNDVARGYVDDVLKKYVGAHPQYVTDENKCEKFFAPKSNNSISTKPQNSDRTIV